MRGNSRKPPVSFLKFTIRGGILRVDCFQVWKPSGNHIGPGFPRNENYGKTTDVTIPCGFQQVSIFGRLLFYTQCHLSLYYSFILLLKHFQKTLTRRGSRNFSKGGGEENFERKMFVDTRTYINVCTHTN